MKKRKRISIILVCLLVISCTAGGTYSYFNSKIELSSLMNTTDNSGKLDVQNGKINLEFLNENINWTGNANTEASNNEFTIKDPKYGAEINYGPVSLSLKDTNLTTNVDLQINVGVGSEQEIITQPETEATPFECIVGDMDNFGSEGGYLLPNKTSMDPYSGLEAQNHSIDIYPENDDPQGTDRRMVVSGFYNVLESLAGGQMNQKIPNWYTNGVLSAKKSYDKLNNNDTVGGFEGKYDSLSQYYFATLKNQFNLGNIILPKNYIFWYDGYTERAIEGRKQNGDDDNVQHNVDGKDWRYLQRVEPIIFKYDCDGKVTSAVFQIYTDDLQSGSATTNIAYDHFTNVSSSYFTVKLNGIEIPEFSKVLNTFNQQGPHGNMITLSLPTKYLGYITQGSRSGGLQLTIDDERIGTSGDSYVIDFAKLTVNAPAAIPESSRIKLSGKITDKSGKPISGATVMSGDGRKVTTNENGVYLFDGTNKVAAGIVSITVEASGYETTSFTLDKNTTSDATLDGELEASQVALLNGSFQVEVTVVAKDTPISNIFTDKLENTQISYSDPLYENGAKTVTTYTINMNEETKIAQAQHVLAMEPGKSYDVSYKIILPPQEGNASINLTSNLVAKATQENNPGWQQNGMEDLLKTYKSEFTVNSSETEPENPGSTQPTNTDTLVCFEIPESIKNNITNTNDLTLYKNDNSMVANAYNNANKTLKSTEYINKWCEFNLGNTTNQNSAFKVIAGSYDTGNLYYFNTKKVFICTNGNIVNSGNDSGGSNIDTNILKINIDSSTLKLSNNNMFTSWWNKIYYFSKTNDNVVKEYSNSWPGNPITGGFGIRTITLSGFGTNINGRYIVLVNGNKPNSEKTVDIRIPDGATEVYINNLAQVYKYKDSNGKEYNN